MSLLVGKNARENWDIIKQSPVDHVWFHLKSFPSPHIILQDCDPDDEDIILAANKCKSNSKYKNVKNIKVMYTYLSNISLGKEIGSVTIKSRRKCKYITI